MLVGVEYLSDLGVGNVVGTIPLILISGMHGFLGCNIDHIGSGHGMVQGTIRLLPLMPTSHICLNLHILPLCILVVQVGNGSNRMVCSVLHMRILLGRSEMLS